MKYIQRTSKGYWYFRHPTGFRAPLPCKDLHPEKFEASYRMAMLIAEGREQEAIEQSMRKHVGGLVKKAHYRAVAANRNFEITRNDIYMILAAQNFRCALTGMKFDASMAGTVSPFSPSIDRIDNAMGYTVGNVRIVTAIANYAKNRFSDDVFYAMCSAAHIMRQEQNGSGTLETTSVNSVPNQGKAI